MRKSPSQYDCPFELVHSVVIPGSEAFQKIRRLGPESFRQIWPLLIRVKTLSQLTQTRAAMRFDSSSRLPIGSGPV
jgi:hypothetical protein